MAQARAAEDSPDIEEWCETTWESSSSRFCWFIQDFQWLMDSADATSRLKSKPFFVRAGRNKLMFHLELRAKNEINPTFVALTLVSDSESVHFSDVDILMCFKITIEDAKTRYRRMFPEENVPEEVTAFPLTSPFWRHAWYQFMPRKRGDKREIPDFVLRDDLTKYESQFLYEGHLSLVCDVKTETPKSRNCSPLNNAYISATSTDGLSKDLGGLKNDPQFSDFTLVCGSERFPCHKAVLAARSSVFYAMLANQKNKEAQKDEAIIVDLKPDVVKKLLDFLYTDKVKDLPECAPGLLQAADKYNLQNLKGSKGRFLAWLQSPKVMSELMSCKANACAEEMIRQLGVDNATEVLRLAHLHWCPELKLAAMQFIAANYSAMVESETWHEFATLYWNQVILDAMDLDQVQPDIPLALVKCISVQSSRCEKTTNKKFVRRMIGVDQAHCRMEDVYYLRK